MNLNEQTFTSINLLQTAIRDHFEKMLFKITSISNKSATELTVFSRFLENVLSLGVQFEKSLFKTCEEFQLDMKESIVDEKITNYFQLMINSILRFGDVIHKVNDSFKHGKNQISELTKNSKIIQTNTIALISTTTSEYKNSLQKFEMDYRKFVRSMISYSSVNNKNTESGNKRQVDMVEVNEFLNSKKHEENVIDQFQKMKSSLNKNFECIKQKIERMSQLELENKLGIKKSVLLLLNNLRTIHSKDPTEQLEVLEDNSVDFKSEFKSLFRESLLEFNECVRFSDEKVNFVTYAQFLKVNFVFENSFSKMVFSKLAKLTPEISPRVRVYVDLFFDFFYTENVEFSKEIIEELNTLLMNKRTREFFVYSMIMKKCTVFGIRPFATITLKKEQFRNLQPVSQYLFLNYLDLADVDYELIYFFLKFTITIFNEQKNCFVETCLKIVIFYEVEFWRNLFEYLVNTGQAKFSDLKHNVNNVLNGQFLFGIKKIVKNLKTSTEMEKHELNTKAFDEIVSILFKLKLDFETIVDILILISKTADVNADYVKMLLVRNQDLLVTQVSGQAIIQSDFKTNSKWTGKCLTKEQKVCKVIQKIFPFLENGKDYLKVIMLNKTIYKMRSIFMNAILLTIQFSPKSRLRKEVLSLRINPESMVNKLIKVPIKDPNSIISLDVLRTSSHDPKFNAEAIERILNNISNPNQGKFSYYQGLNYIVTYFYLIFDGNEVLTYNFVITMINNDFANYIDPELKNVKKLFYYLKKFLKNNLPVLQNYLETEQKIDTDIIFASWCLTLFTTITQYQETSQILDEIIDIFLAQGWTGFFKVLLVILDEMQDKILKMNYEEILMGLSDLPKTNFRDMENDQLPGQRKSLKEKIKKFKNVKKSIMVYYQFEFHQMLEKVEEIWHKINKKIKNKINS